MAIQILEQKLENNLSEINEQLVVFSSSSDELIIETTGYRWTVLSILSGNSNIVWQGSFDKTTWNTMNAFAYNAGNYASPSTFTSTGTWLIENAGFDYLKLSVGAYVSQTKVAVIQDKNCMGIMGVNPFVTSNVSPGGTAGSIKPVLVGGIDGGNLARILRMDTNGYPQTQLVNNLFYNEGTVALSANGILTGTSRDVGVATATQMGKASFNAIAVTDQTGAFKIQMSNDNVTWRDATIATAVTANTPVILSIPVMTRYHRVYFQNGAIAQTFFMVNSSYTDN